MRLFIAIQLNEAVNYTLTEIQDALRRRGVGGNYTRPENLHLTLAFIGEYTDPDWVFEVMQSVPFRPFDIRLEGFGCFGDLYWCGVGGHTELTAYVQRLRRALAEAEIPFDHKRFSPHITLLRKATFRGNKMPGVIVPDAGMEVTQVSLMRSDRGKQGTIYTELGAVDV